MIVIKQISSSLGFMKDSMIFAYFFVILLGIIDVLSSQEMIYNGTSICHVLSRLQGPVSYIQPMKHRFIVVADVHGSYDELKHILDHANITDASYTSECVWDKSFQAKQSTVLIQLGDVVDRGMKSFDVWFHCLNTLQDSIPQGSKFIRLLG